jgi:hypothetical protein
MAGSIFPPQSSFPSLYQVFINEVRPFMNEDSHTHTPAITAVQMVSHPPPPSSFVRSIFIKVPTVCPDPPSIHYPPPQLLYIWAAGNISEVFPMLPPNVSNPYPDWIRIQLGQRWGIRIQAGQNCPLKK